MTAIACFQYYSVLFWNFRNPQYDASETTWTQSDVNSAWLNLIIFSS